MIKQRKIVNLLFGIVKDNLPCQAQGRLKNSPGRRSNFPAKDLVLNSSFLQKICAKVSSGVKLLHLKQLLLLQAAVLHAWVLQLPQLVILPGCQPTPLSPPHSSCPCDSNSEKVINFYYFYLAREERKENALLKPGWKCSVLSNSMMSRSMEVDISSSSLPRKVPSKISGSSSK